VGSIIHAWERLVVSRGGLDVENDVRIAPMDPPAMLPALETKAIDGFATSLPFTTQAVVKGAAISFASGVHDAPDLLPFAYGLVYTKPQTCAASHDKCARVVRALAASVKFIKDKPEEALAILRKRFAKMDADVLAAAWKDVSKAHAENLHVAVAALEHSQNVSLEAKLLAKKDALANFDGLFTDEYLK
jgi:ABC-type nitrate/sulfonate/bicarbonate transport system substrate-binding protein